MATQIQTTVGEVRAACECIVKSHEEQMEAERARRVEEKNQHNATHQRAVEQCDREYITTLAEWTTFPFYKRWFTPKPKRVGVFTVGGSVVSAFFDEGAQAYWRALQLQRAFDGLPPLRTVMLDITDAEAIGLGGKYKEV